MTNQAAQTMPECTYMTREESLKIVRACAYAKRHTHGYLPRTAQEAADWQPHEWVLDAIRWNAILQPVMVSEAGVPEGWVLVPARMELTPENMAALAFMLGGDPDAKDVDERWNGGTLWVGETVGDNGEKYYGLNVANVECYEEGSIPIVEFASAPAASGVHPDALPDGTLSKSTAKRVTALAAASVSELARVDALALDVARRFTQDTEPQRRASLQVAVIAALEQALTQQRGGSVEMSPEFTDSARGAIAWVLYHHQGGSSPVGQPLRFALGIGAHERMSDEQIRMAKVYAELMGRTTADFHAARTTPQPSADAVRELVKRAYEVVHHDDECTAIGGNGDKDCRCDAVPFLRELESLLSGGSHA